MLKWLENKLKKDKHINEVSNKNNIDIISYANFLIVDIKNDCTISDYINETRGKLSGSIICNSVLFDKGFNMGNIRKKKIYAFYIDNIVYNMFIEEDKIFINEKVYKNQRDVYIDDRTITINPKNGNYDVNNITHNINLSSGIGRFYSSYKPYNDLYKEFYLSEEDAKKIALEITSNLERIPNLNKILDLDKLKSYLSILNKNKNI